MPLDQRPVFKNRYYACATRWTIISARSAVIRYMKWLGMGKAYGQPVFFWAFVLFLLRWFTVFSLCAVSSCFLHIFSEKYHKMHNQHQPLDRLFLIFLIPSHLQHSLASKGFFDRVGTVWLLYVFIDLWLHFLTIFILIFIIHYQLSSLSLPDFDLDLYHLGHTVLPGGEVGQDLGRDHRGGQADSRQGRQQWGKVRGQQGWQIR